MNHPGEELVIVLEGRMEFEVDGECHEVGAGDSIHFRAVRPHSWRNPATSPRGPSGSWSGRRSMRSSSPSGGTP